MSAATAAKATPSVAALDEMSWNRLNDLACTSKNRELLARIVHAENACIADAPTHHIQDNRTVAQIIYRAIQNGWNDVLESAVTSRHMTLQDHANILRSAKVFSKAVYQGILESRASESPAILSMLGDAPYASVREGAEAKQVAIVIETLEAARTNPEAYAVEDGDEHENIFQAVNITLELDRHDLLTELIATGCTGSVTADRLALNFNAQLQAA